MICEHLIWPRATDLSKESMCRLTPKELARCTARLGPPTRVNLNEIEIFLDQFNLLTSWTLIAP